MSKCLKTTNIQFMLPFNVILTITNTLKCDSSIQDIAILFNVIIILLLMFNTYVFQVGLVSLLLQRFRALLGVSALYLALSICLHCWLMVASHV